MKNKACKLDHGRKINSGKKIICQKKEGKTPEN